MDSCAPDQNFINLGIKRRKELLEKKDFPRLEELYQSQGKIFGQILVNQMSPIAKILLKADKEHKMPDENHYIAPVDRILEIIDPCRKPCRVNANRIELVKATTFTHILQQGAKLEKKMSQKEELKIEKAIQDNSEFERYEANQRLTYALREQEELFTQKLDRFREKINRKFQEKMKQLEKFYDKKYSKMLKDVVEDSNERLEMLHLKMQREIDESVTANNELNIRATDISKVPETAEKEIGVDLLTFQKEEFKEERFKEQCAKETQNLTSVLHFVSAARNEQNNKNQQMKQDYLNTLKVLKDVIDKISTCFSSDHPKETKMMKKCSCMIKNFQKLHTKALNSINEFEAKYNADFCKFLKEPFCAFIIPEEITKQIICQCHSPSSTDTEESVCAAKLVPKIIKQTKSRIMREDPLISLEQPKLQYCVRVDEENFYLEKTKLIEEKQKLIDIIDLPFIINQCIDFYIGNKDLIEDVASGYLTQKTIEKQILDLITSRVYRALNEYDFSWLQNFMMKSTEEKFEDDENNLDGKMHHYFDFNNRKKLPKYLSDGHGNKTYVYKELTKDELIEIYKKRD